MKDVPDNNNFVQTENWILTLCVDVSRIDVTFWVVCCCGCYVVQISDVIHKHSATIFTLDDNMTLIIKITRVKLEQPHVSIASAGHCTCRRFGAVPLRFESRYQKEHTRFFYKQHFYKQHEAQIG